MTIEEKLRLDLWKAIQAHYERKDYTEAVRDVIFHICEVLREKSGLVDRDGSKLIDEALLGRNPLIKINKNETSTEKDIQQGVAFALKGLMQSIRNPLSHEKTVYSEADAEAIILYSNYLLNQVDKSKSISRIGDIKELLYDDDFTSSEEYAKCLIKEVPAKKRFDLLVSLYNDRENLPQNTLVFFIDELINSLSKNTFDDYLSLVSSSLIKCKDDKALRMYFHYFMKSTYERIDKLAQLRIEDLIEKSLRNGRYEDYFKHEGNSVHKSKRVNSIGSLATWVRGKIQFFNSYETIMEILYSKLERGSDESEFVLLYFPRDLVRDNYDYKPTEIRILKDLLLKGNVDIFFILTSDVEFSFERDNPISDLFEKELLICKEIMNNADDIPF